MVYAPPTLIGYNANPPEDDGSEVSTNEITWAGIKEKIGDPLKAYIDATQSAIASEFTSIATPGWLFLTSGSVTNQPTKDIVLSAYTAFRAIKFVLTKFTPVAADDYLSMTVSIDGGSNFLDDYTYTGIANNSLDQSPEDWSDNLAPQLDISNIVGSGTGDAANAEITLYSQSEAVLYKQVNWVASSISAGGPEYMITASGRILSVDAVNAVRFFFFGSNIEFGTYAVYGLK